MSSIILKELKEALAANSNKEYAKTAQWFFKTGPGGYGEGDQFIGIRVPIIRKIGKHFSSLSFNDLKALISSPVHEERLLAVLILVDKFKKGNEPGKEKVFGFYMKNRKRINNWDLIDLSAPNIVGTYLLDKDKDLLFKFASSGNLWEKRIAVLSTFAFIKAGESGTILKIAAMLLNDEHDLIHKAVGWMLRELGKRNIKAEEEFLKTHYRKMPRTMLRYAIEKFPEKKRLAYLLGKI